MVNFTKNNSLIKNNNIEWNAINNNNKIKMVEF